MGRVYLSGLIDDISLIINRTADSSYSSMTVLHKKAVDTAFFVEFFRSFLPVL